MLELDLQLATEAPAPGEPSSANGANWPCASAAPTRDDHSPGRRSRRPRTESHLAAQKDYATNVLSFPADVPDEFSTSRCWAIW
jgi:probable rRNA maturation factor